MTQIREEEKWQEKARALEKEMQQRNRQLEVIMSSIQGGLKISNDDETYSFAFVSQEAAALFGYTVEEFLEVTGGTAVGTVYPPDLEQALAACEEAFRDGGTSYAARYRVRCKDGSLKWILDSGKKAKDDQGNWMINSLYLDVTKAEKDASRYRDLGLLLQSVFDTVPCGILRFVRMPSGECRLIFLNRAARQLLGYDTLEDVYGDWKDGVLGNVTEEGREILRSTYRMLHEVGDRQDREYRVRWKDGSIHWLEGTNMVVERTEDGSDVIQRTFVEITRRKVLQEQLAQEQEMYRVAMESSTDAMYEYRMDQDLFISYDPAPDQGVIRREIPAYSRLLAENRIIYPEDIPVVRDNICKGRSEVFEVRSTIPEGEKNEYFWHRFTSRLILRDGKPERVVGTIRNIHSEKESLLESNERLHMNRSALQAISGMYLCIFYINFTEDQYYGVRLPEMNGEEWFRRTGSYAAGLCPSLLKLVAEEDRDRIRQVCDREALSRYFLEGSGPLEIEFRQKSEAEPVPQWLRLELHPVARESSGSRTAILTLRNVSEEKQQELERRTEERAARQALSEAYEGAKRANLAKSEFLSRMSHDIRTPMNAILGMTAIAEMQMDNRRKVEDCLKKIKVSGNHLLQLINEVLDMSKIESGDAVLNESSFLLSETLDTVGQIIRADTESRGQSFQMQVKLQNDNVVGDSIRVQQILINLLSNAVKYTDRGGHILLRATQRHQEQRKVGCYEFVIEDDGIGIDQEFQERMFQPFEREENPRVQKVQGTGLGLAITYNLVQMLSGNIQVESVPGQGSRFTVTIFLKLSGEKYKKAGIGKEEDLSFPKGGTVLLAEDNEINREIVVELLRMAGMETVIAVNGKEALDLFTYHPPGTYCLILMDIRMPVMDGYSATRAIRRLAETKGRRDAAEIPIIALTANAFADDAYRAGQAGMNEHVAKPLEPHRLLEILHRWVK